MTNPNTLRKSTTDCSDYLLDKTVRVLPYLGTALFAYNAYVQVIENDDSLESSFSVAVFGTFLVSVVSVNYAHSLPQGSEKQKARTLPVVVGLLTLIAAIFLFRAWMVLPPQSRWVILLASFLPAFAVFAFLSMRRSLVSSSSLPSSL